MEDKAHTQRFETEVPTQLLAELDELRQSLESHRKELTEELLREDVKWGLQGQD